MAVSLLSASAVLFFSVIFKIELKWNYRVFKGYDDTAHILTAWIVTIINLFKQKKKRKKKTQGWNCVVLVKWIERKLKTKTCLFMLLLSPSSCAVQTKKKRKEMLVGGLGEGRMTLSLVAQLPLLPYKLRNSPGFRKKKQINLFLHKGKCTVITSTSRRIVKTSSVKVLVTIKH